MSALPPRHPQSDLFRANERPGYAHSHPHDLQAVSGADARAKTHFYIIDAVGVCESDKTDSRPLERQRTVPFDKLLLGVASANATKTH
jgi:hypothetical protein